MCRQSREIQHKHRHHVALGAFEQHIKRFKLVIILCCCTQRHLCLLCCCHKPRHKSMQSQRVAQVYASTHQCRCRLGSGDASCQPLPWKVALHREQRDRDGEGTVEGLQLTAALHLQLPFSFACVCRSMWQQLLRIRQQQQRRQLC